jgi:hypothetical protein
MSGFSTIQGLQWYGLKLSCEGVYMTDDGHTREVALEPNAPVLGTFK